MGKTKALKHNANKRKQQLHEIKGSSIKKNKDSKFKNTPKGKVALINNSVEIFRKLSPKVSSETQSPDQEPTSNKNKVLKKYWDQKFSPTDNAVAKRSKQDSPNKKQNFKQSTNSSKAQKIGKKTFNSKKAEKQLDKSNFNTTESEDDSLNKSDETSESDSNIRDILGKSLGEKSDDEDEDYEQDEEEEDTDGDDDSDEEEMSERKDIKMFKGLQSKTKKNKKDQEDDEVESNENTTESDEDDDEDDADEDEDTDKEKQKKKDDHIKKPKIRISQTFYTVVDSTVSENSDSDDYFSDTDNSDDEDAELGTKILLDQRSIADDDDDEDFNEDDEDSSDEDAIIISESEEDSEEDSDEEDNYGPYEDENNFMKRLNITPKEKADLTRRIVLIDNISKTTTETEILQLCHKYGDVQLMEARPYPAFFVDPKKAGPLWVLESLDRDYPHLETYSVNVLLSTRQGALKVIMHIHGMELAGNYLNAVTADEIEREPLCAVYMKNLKSTMSDNYIWKLFSQCGNIIRMRNVRDSVTGLSRGFGYVSLSTLGAVNLALKYNNVKLNGQRIQVLPYPYRDTPIKKIIEELKLRYRGILESGKNILLRDNRSSKKFKKSSGEPAIDEPERNVKKHKKQEEDEKPSTAFQGQMVKLKNKNKKNKLDKKKKRMAEMLVAKSKKTKKN